MYIHVHVLILRRLFRSYLRSSFLELIMLDQYFIKLFDLLQKNLLTSKLSCKTYSEAALYMKPYVEDKQTVIQMKSTLWLS